MNKNILIVTLLLSSLISAAQDVTLVAWGEGPTKNDATIEALRFAVAEVGGVFVSGNTTILNDELLRDEIVSTTTGNIKKYKELSCNKTGDIYQVTVSATVSVGKLIEFTLSHGGSAEFDGNTFTKNIRLLELNQRNETAALENLLAQLKFFQNDLFDYKIVISNPRKVYFDGTYNVAVKVLVIPNENYKTFFNILTNTLKSLSMSESELAMRHKSGDYSGTRVGLNFKGHAEEGPKDELYTLRTDYLELKKFIDKICNILNDSQMSFVVVPKGTSRGYFTNHEEIRRFHVLELGDLIMIGCQQSPASYFYSSYFADRIPLKTDKAISSPKFIFNYKFEELEKLKGFDVKKYPIEKRNK